MIPSATRHKILAWTLGVAAILPPIAYALYALMRREQVIEQTFLQDLMASWAATALGVGAGMPIALRVNRINQDQQQALQIQLEEQARLQKEQRVAAIIYTELQDAYAQTEAFLSDRSIALELPTARWRVLTGAGAIDSFRNIEHLTFIAHAYEKIDRFNFLAAQTLTHHLQGGYAEKFTPRSEQLLLAAAHDVKDDLSTLLASTGPFAAYHPTGGGGPP